MANNNNNNIMVPQAKEAMEKFKMEAASQVGVNLKQGYNGDISSRDAGRIGGNITRRVIEEMEKSMSK